MMSGNSFLTNMKLEFRRRMWNIALVGLVLNLFLLVGSFLALNSVEANAARLGLRPYEILDSKLASLHNILGLGSVNPFLTVILAIVLAVGGFAYLDSKQEIDFYESQPVSRRTRFLSVLGSGLFIYLCWAFLARMAGILLALAMGGMTKVFFLECLLQYFRELVLFLGVYSIASLAMMLCGNVLIALLGTAVLLGYELWIRALNWGFQAGFYRTYYEYKGNLLDYVWSSPIAYYIRGLYPMADAGLIYRTTEGKAFLEKGLHAMFGEDEKSLLLSIIVLLLTYLIYRLRKNESAGQAIVFRKMQILIKFALVIPAAMMIGLLVASLQNYSDSALSLGTTVLMILLFVLIFSMLMEIIYSFSFKGLLRHPWEILAIAVLSLLGFGFYQQDLGGYDRYVPKTEEIESVGLYTGGYYSSYTEMDEHGQVKYDSDLTDYGKQKYQGEQWISDLRELAEKGQEYLKSTPREKENGFSMTVIYQLKNGREMGRQILLPYDIDPEIMDRVLGSEEYKNSKWLLSGYPFEAGHGKYTSFNYESSYLNSKEIEGSDSMVQDFLRAYQADLAQYNFRFAVNNDRIGSVNFITSPSPEDHYLYGGYGIDYPLEKYLELKKELQELPSYSHEYPVYPSYQNTIAFLKKYGIFTEAKPDVSAVSGMKLNYYVKNGTNNASENVDDIGNHSDGEWKALEITDPSEMELLLSAATTESWYDEFHNPEIYEENVSLELSLKTTDREGEEEAVNWENPSPSYSFRKGQIPEGILERMK